MGTCGSGAFGNDPNVMGNLFADVIAGVIAEAQANAALAEIFYSEIHFAIPFFGCDDKTNTGCSGHPIQRLATSLGKHCSTTMHKIRRGFVLAVLMRLRRIAIPKKQSQIR